MRGPNRQRKPGRREPFRDPKPTLLIVCEGLNTEPQYFVEFAKHHRNPRVKVKIAPQHGVPLTLVQVAKQYRDDSLKAARREHDENIAYDSVWCVFDIDEHPNVPQAKQVAGASGIKVAVSNPCFELWLLLHVRDSPGMQHRHAVQQMLKNILGEYNKHIDFGKFSDGYKQAVARARRLHAIAELAGTPGHNPTTNVHELTESIAASETGEDTAASQSE